jgi:hypothetical protein
MQTELIAERAARNQSTFRGANEKIAERAADLIEDESGVPLICECPDPRCTAITRLSLVDYEAVRSRGDWFLVVPGHETCVIEGEKIATVVRRNETYSLMEKVGVAGEIAEDLDPRG